MLTNAATHAEHIRRSAAPPAQKVVIVNGNAAILNVLETVLDAGHYDVVFVEPTAHAYSQIKRVQPNLVILCINLDDLGGTDSSRECDKSYRYERSFHASTVNQPPATFIRFPI